MPDQPAESEHPSPLNWARRAVRSAWNDLTSVYYANTLIWRLLKSAALVFLGFFAWSGANLLLSYRPDWGTLYYVMAYGFAVIFWGPLTHFVVVPAVIRLRRSEKGGLRQWFARHGSKANLTVFLVIVLLLGTFPVGPMTFEFQVGGGGDGDVSPQLQCTKSGGTIHCHLSQAGGVDSVVVSSGETELAVIDEPPFDFDIDERELETVSGDRQFTVEVRDENGDTVRRFIRRADLIPG